MTKREYIAHHLCETALEMQRADTREALRNIQKSLLAIAAEIERLVARFPGEGGEAVTNPVPAPVKPTPGTTTYTDNSGEKHWGVMARVQAEKEGKKVDPIAAIKAMAANR